MEENNFVHLIDKDNSSTSIANCFISVLEHFVGADYYSYLYLSFSSLEALKNKNLLLREKIKENNILLDSYQVNVDNLKSKLSSLKKVQLKEIEDSIELKYNPDLNDKIDKIRNEIDDCFNELLQANDLLLPSEKLDEEISSIKAEIKEIMADIKFSYDGLRSLGSLKIFYPQTKEECGKEFTKMINNIERGVHWQNAFEKLWELALNEANGLNKIANMAKQISLKYPTGLEEFDELDLKKIDLALNEYDTNFSKLSKITNEELV